jgi:hypothetical protein
LLPFLVQAKKGSGVLGAKPLLINSTSELGNMMDSHYYELLKGNNLISVS